MSYPKKCVDSPEEYSAETHSFLTHNAEWIIAEYVQIFIHEKSRGAEEIPTEIKCMQKKIDWKYIEFNVLYKMMLFVLILSIDWKHGYYIFSEMYFRSICDCYVIIK